MAGAMVEDARATRTVRIQSELFGELEIPKEVCLTFDEGLLGFPESKKFVLLPATPDGVLWLHGVDDPSLAFLVIDPYSHFPDFVLDVPDADQAQMGLRPDSETAVLAIVTHPRSGSRATCNLQGPIVVDFTSRRGWQVIVADSDYGTRHEIDLPLRSNADA